MRCIELCAGDGGGLLANLILGHTTICAVEREPHCQAVLRARQKQSLLPEFPIHDDVRTFDGRPWRGSVDVLSGGIPCQGFSGAGKQLGEFDPRNLWPDALRILKECRAPWFFLENVDRLTSFDYWGVILQDLATAGYDARWCVLSAGDVGAPHLRKRIWLLATDTDAYRRGCDESGISRGMAGVVGGRQDDPMPAEKLRGVADPEVRGRDAPSIKETGEHYSRARPTGTERDEQAGGCGQPESMANANGNGRDPVPVEGSNDAECHTEPCSPLGHAHHARPQVGEGEPSDARPEQPTAIGAGGGSAQPDVGGMADGIPNRLDRPNWWSRERGLPRVAGKQPHRADRLRGCGNGQVPLCKAVAWKLLGGPDSITHPKTAQQCLRRERKMRYEQR